MMPLVRDLLTCGLLLLGMFLMFLTALGLLKFPDIFCRGHAQTKGMTVGICSMLLALWLQLDAANAGLIIFFAIAAQVVTIPVAGHMITLLSFQKRVPRFRQKPVAYHKGYTGPRLEP